MRTVRVDTLLWDSPPGAGHDTEWLSSVRDRLGFFLGGVDPECARMAIFAVDELLSLAFGSQPDAVRLQVQRRGKGQTCWVEVLNCTEGVLDNVMASARDRGLSALMLDNACSAWGVVYADTSNTLWAQLPLVPE